MQSDYSIDVPKISVRSIWTSAFYVAKRQIEAQVDELNARRVFWYGSLAALTLWFAPMTVLKLGIALYRRQKRNQVRQRLPQEIWRNAQPQLVKQFRNIMTRLQKKINALINDFCGRYTLQFNRELQKRQEDMESLKMDERTNEELRDEISDLEASKQLAKESIKKCTQIAGEL